jgi:hypothetical protein
VVEKEGRNEMRVGKREQGMRVKRGEKMGGGGIKKMGGGGTKDDKEMQESGRKETPRRIKKGINVGMQESR